MLYLHSPDVGFKTFPITAGVAGQAILMGKSLSIPDMYNDPYFNPLIDISCSYPVVIMPIYNESNVIVSVVEYTNIKGMARRAQALKSKT